MKNKYLLCLIVMMMATSLSFTQVRTSEGLALKEFRGTERVILVDEKSLDENRVEVNTAIGREAVGKLKIKENNLLGEIIIEPDTKDQRKYIIESAQPFEEKGLKGFRGKIKNSDLSFEAFLVNEEKVVFNIFSLQKINEEEIRMDPVTVVLDGGTVVKTKEVQPLNTQVEMREAVGEAGDIGIDSSAGFVYFRYSERRGFNWGVSGWQNQSISTPWNVHYWTRPDDAIADADQTAAQIVRVNIYRLETKQAGQYGSCHYATEPAQSGVTSFSVPFYIPKIGWVQVGITVRTSTVIGTGDNPCTVKLYWLNKKASDYAGKSGSRGTGAKFNYEFGVADKSHGKLLVTVTHKVIYEII
ncbi:MAG TPA: hypothetical protein GX697_04550, partial [Firmicutes bacterium]|nr:hypothetical protein [Bacillota bacterium]